MNVTSALEILLGGVATLVGESVGVREPVGFAVDWYEDEEDGHCVDVTARAMCGCETTVTRYLDRGTLHPHGVVRCVKHTPVVVDRTKRWPEEIPF